MEKNCLVTQLKSRTGNTDLPVMGFMKIKISSIAELNEDPWNIFTFKPIKGKSVTVKILGEGYMYNSSQNRETNTDGVKSLTFMTTTPLFFSNGDYEILIEKYTVETIEILGDTSIRSDNIHFDYKTFENSNLNKLLIKFIQTDGIVKYPLNTSGSIKNLPSTITILLIYGDTEHPVQLEDLAPVAMNLNELNIFAMDASKGSFDNLKFNKVMDRFDIAFCNFTGNVKNVPIAIDSSVNYGFNVFYGNAQEPIERMAKNATTVKNVFYYVQENQAKVFWREDMSFNNLPTPGFLYLTLDGTGGVTVYGDEARTNLLGSFNGTTWSYPS